MFCVAKRRQTSKRRYFLTCRGVKIPFMMRYDRTTGLYVKQGDTTGRASLRKHAYSNI